MVTDQMEIEGLRTSVSSSAFVAASEWISKLTDGSVFVSIAVIAVATFGFNFLAGRMPARRVMACVLGLFVRLTASLIATGLTSLAAPGSSPVAEPLYSSDGDFAQRTSPSSSPQTICWTCQPSAGAKGLEE